MTFDTKKYFITTMPNLLSILMFLTVVLADWKVKTPCHANGEFINKMLSLNRKKFKLIRKGTIY